MQPKTQKTKPLPKGAEVITIERKRYTLLETAADFLDELINTDIRNTPKVVKGAQRVLFLLQKYDKEQAEFLLSERLKQEAARR